MERCPAEEALQRLLDGRPDETDDGALAAHLTHCSRCQERLDRLSDPADVRLTPAVPAATLTETWMAFLHGLAASPPDRSPIPVPLVACPPDYEILGELGRGGMGIVYKARHRKLHRLIALKCLLDPEAGPDRLARFRGEAEAAAKLSHPNIVQIYAIAEHKGRTYLALEYVDGGSLADHLAEAPVEPREAAGLIEVLARAMHAAHQHGVVHRDLKPANILLKKDFTMEHTENTEKDKKDQQSDDTVEERNSDESARSFFRVFRVFHGEILLPKITDFGLAKRVHHEGRLTQTGEILGTPEYMAPEPMTGRRESARQRGRLQGHALRSIHEPRGVAATAGPESSRERFGIAMRDE
jgi:serine/threonine protein kinase